MLTPEDRRRARAGKTASECEEGNRGAQGVDGQTRIRTDRRSRRRRLCQSARLPKLIALWPHEIDDESSEGCRHILAKLRSALRAERRRALSGHWSYDLNRHLGLLSAYKGELAGLSRLER